MKQSQKQLLMILKNHKLENISTFYFQFHIPLFSLFKSEHIHLLLALSIESVPMPA